MREAQKVMIQLQIRYKSIKRKLYHDCSENC